MLRIHLPFSEPRKKNDILSNLLHKLIFARLIKYEQNDSRELKEKIKCIMPQLMQPKLPFSCEADTINDNII
jgi:hypothetical protein